MRASFVAVAATGLMMAGCAITPPRPLAHKPQPMPTRPSCPVMTNADWQPIVDGAVHKTFDRPLQQRFGDTAFQMRIDWSKTDKGDTVITARRIGPAKFVMPQPGQGGEVEMVFRACTGELLKTRKLANLERRPQPLAGESASAPEERSAPSRKLKLKWPWKSHSATKAEQP